MQPKLRVRRWLDGELIDTRDVTAANAETLAELFHGWATMATEAGARWRVMLDDPDGDLGFAVVQEGGPQ